MISHLFYILASVILIQSRSQKASCMYTQTFISALHIVPLVLYVSLQSWPGPHEQPIIQSCLPSQCKTRRNLVALLVAHKISLPGAFLSTRHTAWSRAFTKPVLSTGRVYASGFQGHYLGF